MLPRPVESRRRRWRPGALARMRGATSATKDEAPRPTDEQKQIIPRGTPTPSHSLRMHPLLQPPELLDPIPGLPELNPEQTSGLKAWGLIPGAIFPTLSTPPQNPWPPFCKRRTETPSEPPKLWMNLSARVERSQLNSRSSCGKWLGKPGQQQAHQPEPEKRPHKDSRSHRSCACITPATGDYGDDLREHVTQFTRFCVQSLAQRDLTSSTPTIG